MSDIIASVIDYLGQDSDITAASPAGIFGGELPRTDNIDQPEKAIVVVEAGGGFIGRGYEPYSDTRIDVVCYGATPHEASQLSAAVFLAMKRLRAYTPADGVRLYWARVSAKARPDRDPVTQWPLSISTFQVLAADQA